MEELTVDLGARSYPVLIGPGLLADSGLLARHVGASDLLLVSDATVAPLWAPRLRRALGGKRLVECVLPEGEANKGVAAWSRVIDALAGARMNRDCAVLALGGGVIGDLAGFAAACWLRGVDFVQLPTTLLAQVDSAIGGKTAVNHPSGRNLIGAFHQPRLVLADTSILTTLPRREMLAGYAEVVKYGLIRDPGFFHWLESHGADLIDGERDEIEHAVLASCRAKAEVVAADERESGQRGLLNLGHTFGHALEAETGYGDELLHGEAVAVGMVMAFDLSVQRGHCPPEDADRVRRHLAAVGLPTGFADLAPRHWDVERLIDHMGRDKKVSGGRITFVLVRGIGQAYLEGAVELDEVRALLTAALNDSDQLARENEAPGITSRATLGS